MTRYVQNMNVKTFKGEFKKKICDQEDKSVRKNCEHKDYCNYLSKYGYCIRTAKERCPFYEEKDMGELGLDRDYCARIMK